MSSRFPDTVQRPGTAAAVLLAAGLLAACDQEARPTDSAPMPAPPSEVAVVTTELLAGQPRPIPVTDNPYVVNDHVLGEGERLYAWFNCAGCHGPKGGGGIGPPFLDDDWIYGGAPGNVYQSIVQGRPAGMPSFAPLNDEQVWQLVAYVRSLSPSGGESSGDPAESGGGDDGPTGEQGSGAGRD